MTSRSTTYRQTDRESNYKISHRQMEEEEVTSSQDQPPTSLNEQEEPLLLSRRHPTKKKLALLPLVFLIFFEVSGGPYGEEPTVGSAGPLWAILGFLVFPFVWSLPEALVTAELATAFPSNGGFVIWAHKAFGPFWANLMGSWKFFTGVLNLASYPALTLDYAKLIFPCLSSGTPRVVASLLVTSLLSFLNYTGLAVVGHTAVALGFVSLSPFVILTLASIPKLQPKRWLSLGQEGVQKDWSVYFNTLFWNLNFWDSASTLAGEVEEPRRTFPKALFSAGLLTCLGYVVPLLAATGAVPLEQAEWTDGYFAEVAEAVAGKWLKYYMELAAAMSVMGLYEAQLSSCAYQLLGMTDLGILPTLFGSRSNRFDTPWVGILVSTVIAMGGAVMDFTEIISAVNFLYSLGMLLEFASFLWLRWKKGEVERPFRVGMEMPGLVAMCLVPSGFLVYVMAMGTTVVYVVGGGLTVVGIGWYWVMKLCKSRMWLKFDENNDIY